MDEELLLIAKASTSTETRAYSTYASFYSLSDEQIGDESILQNLKKMTAPCWKQCIYRYPPLINQAWLYWKRVRSKIFF
jgi:hypothetical protein